MADELTTLQDIYLNAVTRHVLLQREADAYIASTDAAATAEGGTASQGEGGREGMETPRRRVGGGGSRLSRKKEGKEERRDRLLAVSARIAPGVAFAHPKGSLKGIRCVVGALCVAAVQNGGVVCVTKKLTIHHVQL